MMTSSGGLAVEGGGGGLYGSAGQLSEFLRPLPPTRYRPPVKDSDPYPTRPLFPPQLQFSPYSTPYLYQPYHSLGYPPPPVTTFKVPPQQPPPPPAAPVQSKPPDEPPPRTLKHRILPPRKRARASGMSLPSFNKGSLIQLASGELKKVEDLTTQDFVSSAEASPALRLDPSTVVRIDSKPESHSALITLMYGPGPNKAQVEYESSVEQPWFVVGETWASVQPDKTLEKFGLKCAQLQVGDVCVSLSPRHSKDHGSQDSRKRRWSAPDELPEPPLAHTRHHKD